MKRRVPTALTSILLAFFAVAGEVPRAAADAAAIAMCGPRKDVVTQLRESFGEVPTAIALTDFGTLLDLLVSPAGTWTILVTTPNGMGCVLATGRHWEAITAPAKSPAA